MKKKLKIISVLSFLFLCYTLNACGAETPTSNPATTTVAATSTSAATATTTNATTTTTVATSATSTTTSATTGSVTQTTIATTLATTTANVTTAVPTATVATTVAPTTTPTVAALADGFVPHTFNHFMIIMLENADYETTLSNPNFAKLAKQGTLLTNYFAITHPSYPNYLALVGGSTFNVTSDGQEDINAKNLADLMDAANVSWKVYAEDLPSKPCYTGILSDNYARKHEPFISFLDVQNNPARCSKINSSNQLQSDLAAGQQPQYAFYVPNLKNDGHDTGVAYAGNWLTKFLTSIQNTKPDFLKNTLVAITFDEGTNGSSNRIYTLLLGQNVKAGVTSNTKYTHYSLLRTVEDNFELGTLGENDAKANPINDVWSK